MSKLEKFKKIRRIEKLRWIRILVQIIFFIAAPSIFSGAFTAVKKAFVLIGAGKPLELDYFAMQFFIVIAVTITLGRFFCGWACAFGALNDWIFQLSQFVQRKTKKKLPKIPEKLAKVLEKLKYVVLVFLLALCFFQKGNLITENSPWTVFSLIRSGRLTLSGYETGIVLLVVCFIGMCFSERFFCRFFCPMRAVFSLLPVILQLRRNNNNCPEKCGACKRVCPADILIEENNLRMGECIKCERCKVICPKKNIGL